MGETFRPDICVIGGGPGGLSVAAAAAAFGVPVVLIEKGRMGGNSLHSGSIPSKALIAAADQAERPLRAGGYGVTVARPAIDFARVQASIHGMVAAIAPNDSAARLRSLGVRVIEGTARFKNLATVAVGEDEVAARRFVIASGSLPSIPPVLGLKETAHFTNETIFDLKQAPDHLIVLGAGRTGLELAQAHRRLGARVTVIEAAAPLHEYDAECVTIVLEQFAREGIAVHTGAEAVRVEAAAGGVRVTLKAAAGPLTVEGSHLLVAAGRRANIENLNLEAAGVRYGPQGIIVDSGLRTSNKRIFAIGDVIGAPRFTHAANHHAGIVIRQTLFRSRAAVDADLIPQTVFTDPELAQVGLSEAEARKRHRDIRFLRAPFYDNDRAIEERRTRGHVKLITTGKGRLLGATIVGDHASELISLWTLALQQRLDVEALAGLAVPYPTLSEAGKRAIMSAFMPRLTNLRLRRIIAILRRFG